MRLAWRSAACACVLALGAGAPVGLAQQENPVFLDDSPLAQDTLGRLDDLIAIESWGEAARVLQRLLDEEGQRLLVSPDDPDLFLSVRRAVHERLLASPELLERYREAQDGGAREMVESGDWSAAERTRLLTPWGFEAAMRVAQGELESARFRGAARTLAQLEAHPDRTGARGAGAARLLALAARYLDDDGVRALATRWAGESGIQAPDMSPIPGPPGASPEVRSALEPEGAPEVDLGSLGRTPLRSEELSPVDSRVIDGPAAQRDQRPGERVRSRTYAWTMPTVVGDTLYVCDGITVSAWDRFTLGPIWRRRIGPAPGQGTLDRYLQANRQRLGQGLEDSASVTIVGDMLLATSGLAKTGMREDGGEIVALDRHTGELLWSVDPSRQDESLEQASVRGPVIADDGSIVVSMRKSVRTRRLISSYLVGLDPATGAVLWTRLTASAGSLPFQQVGMVSDAGAASGGVTIRADEIGVVEAIESHSGRPLWARRFAPAAFYRPQSSPPWSTPAPIIDGGSAVLLTPDRTRVVRLDLETGAVLASRPAEEFGEPSYLVRVGGTLAAVSDDRVAFVDIRRFHADPVRTSNPLDPVEVSGRATPAGGSLLLPTHDSVVVLDPHRPRDTTRVGLDLTGNLLALDGQLIAVGEFEAHSYLEWRVASDLLERRMRLNPEDPTPAITLAELAYRAGEHDRIASAADAAIRAIRGLDDRAGGARATDRLFDSLLAMVQGAGDGGEASAISVGSIRRGLIERLGQLARTPEQRVSHLMALGRLRDQLGDGPGAVDAYQVVLGDPSLATATWHGSELAVRAQLEATRRVHEVLLARGQQVYRTHDAEARIEKDLLGDAPADEVAALARRFPAATVAPGLWSLAADRYEREGRPHAGERALRAAILASEHLTQVGAPIPLEQHGEIVGRMATSLALRSRHREAAAVVARAQELRPGLVATRDGVSIDLAALAGRASSGRLAVIGHRLSTGEPPTVLAGVPALVLDPGDDAPTDRALLVSETRSELSMVAIDDGGVRVAWTHGIDPDAVVLRADAGGVLLHAGEGAGGSFWRLGIEDGRVIWSALRVGATLGEMDERPSGSVPTPGPARFESPLDGPVTPDALVISSDDQTLVVGDRVGRLIAYDLETGRELWTRRTSLAWVHDLDVGAGIAAVGGVTPGGSRRAGMVPSIEALDARTGEVISPIEGVSSEVRWVRVSGSGDLITGLATAVVSLNVIEGRVNWVTSSLATDASLGAWLLDERMVVMDADGGLWLGDASVGSIASRELELRSRRNPDGDAHVHGVGDRLLVGDASGLRVFDREGRVVGGDALDTDGRFLAPAVARGLVVAVERRLSPTPAGRGDVGESWAHVFESDSGRLLASYALPLVGEPVGVATIDGHVLIGIGDATLVVEAPADGAP